MSEQQQVAIVLMKEGTAEIKGKDAQKTAHYS